MTEANLLLRLQEHDEEALKSLYSQLGRQVYSLAYQLLQDAQEAEEVVQDTFLKLYEKASSYRKNDSARAFIYTIARNNALSRLRKRKIRPKASNDDVYSDHYARHPQEISWSSQRTDQLFIEQLLEKLKDDERELIEQIFMQGYSHQELSDKIGMPLGSLKSKIRRSLLKLRALMEPA